LIISLAPSPDNVHMHASFATRSVSEENTAFLDLLAHASGYETRCFSKSERHCP
jgi:hypothetical protein